MERLHIDIPNGSSSFSDLPLEMQERIRQDEDPNFLEERSFGHPQIVVLDDAAPDLASPSHDILNAHSISRLAIQIMPNNYSELQDPKHNHLDTIDENFELEISRATSKKGSAMIFEKGSVVSGRDPRASYPVFSPHSIINFTPQFDWRASELEGSSNPEYVVSPQMSFQNANGVCAVRPQRTTDEALKNYHSNPVGSSSDKKAPVMDNPLSFALLGPNHDPPAPRTIRDNPFSAVSRRLKPEVKQAIPEIESPVTKDQGCQTHLPGFNFFQKNKIIINLAHKNNQRSKSKEFFKDEKSHSQRNFQNARAPSPVRIPANAFKKIKPVKYDARLRGATERTNLLPRPRSKNTLETGRHVNRLSRPSERCLVQFSTASLWRKSKRFSYQKSADKQLHPQNIKKEIFLSESRSHNAPRNQNAVKRSGVTSDLSEYMMECPHVTPNNKPATQKTEDNSPLTESLFTRKGKASNTQPYNRSSLMAPNYFLAKLAIKQKLKPLNGVSSRTKFESESHSKSHSTAQFSLLKGKAKRPVSSFKNKGALSARGVQSLSKYKKPIKQLSFGGGVLAEPKMPQVRNLQVTTPDFAHRTKSGKLIPLIANSELKSRVNSQELSTLRQKPSNSPQHMVVKSMEDFEVQALFLQEIGRQIKLAKNKIGAEYRKFKLEMGPPSARSNPLVPNQTPVQTHRSTPMLPNFDKSHCHMSTGEDLGLRSVMISNEYVIQKAKKMLG